MSELHRSWWRLAAIVVVLGLSVWAGRYVASAAPQPGSILAVVVGCVWAIQVFKNPLLGVASLGFLRASDIADFWFRGTVLAHSYGMAMYVVVASIGLRWTTERRKLAELFTPPSKVVLAGFWLVTLSLLINGILEEESIGLIAILLKHVVYYFVIISVARRPRDLEFLIWAQLAGGVALALTVGVQFLWFGLGWSWFSWVAQAAPRTAYVSSAGFSLSGTGDRNGSAVMMLFGAGLAWGLYRGLEPGERKRLAALLAFVVLLAGVSLTLSRTGSVGVLILVLGALISTKERRDRIVLLGLTVVMGALTSFQWEAVLGRWLALRGQTFYGYADEWTYRVAFWLEGLRLWSLRPITGYGLNRIIDIGTGAWEAHNTVLEVLLGMGILGFLGWLAMVTMSLRVLWRVANLPDRQLARVASAVLWAYVAIFGPSMFITFAWNQPMWFLFAVASQAWVCAGRDSVPRDVTPIDSRSVGTSHQVLVKS